jgi:ssDNA-binding replication factor A large subunit
LSKGDTYRIADGWIDEYQGQRQIQINEHTAVEKMGASTEASQRD